MAHLSEEQDHVTTSTATPKSTRTSGRLRDIFKPRRSTSAGSPKTPTKSPPALNQTEDIVPSDRESLHAPTEELAGMIDGHVKPAMVSEGSVSGKGQAAFAGLKGVQTAEEAVMEQSGADHEADAKAEVESVGALSASTPVHCDLLAELDARSRQKSFASNIFDDQDSLSAGIRKYVESKIAEAFHRHSCNCPVRAPLNITAKFELDNNGNMSRSSSFKRILTNTNNLHGPKRLGPFVLEYSQNTYNLQKGIISLYILTIMFSAFIGPKRLLITVWRLSAALITYGAAGHMFGWQKNAHPDILLLPVQYVAGTMHNFFCDAIDQYGIFKVYLNSQIMRESLPEVGVVLDPKQCECRLSQGAIG